MRLLLFLPLAGIAAIAGVALWALLSGRAPNEIPSALIGGPVPRFDLPAVEGTASPGLSTADLGGDELALLNVFASWCVPCRAEHATLTDLARSENLALYGLNYKDAPADAAAWLDELGNPYDAIGSDESGRAGLEWGITGVPETFILRGGEVLYRFRGPLVGEGPIGTFMEALDDARG